MMNCKDEISMFGGIKKKILLKKRQIEWRRKNPYNDHMTIENDFDLDLVTVGNHTYGGLRVYNFNSGSRLKIGHFCSISGDVMFILNAEHFLNHVSTYPFKVRVLKYEMHEATSKGDILIDDDVWIGYGATILSGVHIGQGGVIAAGAVVSKDVEPYSIVGGIPAKHLKYRFDPEVRNYLISIDYSKITDEMISEHIDDLYSEVTIDDIVNNKLRWMPKKL